MAADKVGREITDKYDITSSGEQITETWKVWYDVTKNPGDAYSTVWKSAAEAVDDAGMPDYGSAHGVKTHLKVTSISGGHIKGQPNCFKFTVVYSLEAPAGGSVSGAPAFEDYKFSYTYETFNDVFQKWYASDGITEKEYKTPIGESYDPIGLGRYALAITKRWNSSASPHESFKGKIGKANKSAVTLHGTEYAIGELLLGVPVFDPAEYQTSSGVTVEYYKNTVKYLVHPDAMWKISVRAQGLFAHPDGHLMPKDVAGNLEDTGMVLIKIWDPEANDGDGAYVEAGSPLPIDVNGHVVSDLSKAAVQDFFYHRVDF